MSQAPLRDVVKIREMEGPRGGKKYVMQLSCGCLVWGRVPKTKLRCVPCWWHKKEEEEKTECLQKNGYAPAETSS